MATDDGLPTTVPAVRANGSSAPSTGTSKPKTAKPAAAAAAIGNAATAALKVYKDLTLPEAEARLAAAASLVSSLVAQQRAYEAALGKSKKSKKSSDDDDTTASTSSTWCQDVTYALKRLVRGLASSQVSARQGFALALTETLLALPIIDTASVVAAAEKHITLGTGGGAATRQEKKDFYFGRIFVALVLARSQRVRQLSSDKVVATVKELLGYAHATPLIRELAFETIVAIIEQLYFIDVKTHLLPTLLPLFEGKELGELTPELLSLALALDAAFRRAKDNRKELPEFIHDLLSSKSLPKLAGPLSESSYVHPRVHALWSRLAVRLSLDEADDIASEPATPTDNNNDTDASDSKRSKSRKGAASSNGTSNGTTTGNAAVERATAKWARFWTTLVDDNLFGSDSFSKKYLGFQLVELFINRFTTPSSSSSTSSPVTAAAPLSSSMVARIRTMFSPRFFRVFMNHLPAANRTLNKAAISVRQCLVDTATRVPSSALPILMSLVGESRQFDRRTRSKTVQSLIALLSPADVATYVAYLTDTFNGVSITKMREIMARQAVARKQFEEKSVETTNKEKIAKEKATAAAGTETKKSKKAAAADIDEEDIVDTSDAAVAQRVDAERGWALEQLASVLRAQRTAACASPTPVWATAILELFFFHSYFPSFSSTTHTPLTVPSLESIGSVSKTSEVGSAKLVEICRARLATALDFLLPMRLPKLNTKSAAATSDATATAAAGSKKRKSPAGDDAATEDASAEPREDYPSPWALYHIHDYWTSLVAAGHKLVTPLTGDAAAVQPVFVATLSSIRAKVAKKSDKLAKKKSVKADRAEVTVKKEEVERYRALEALSMYLSFLQLSEPDVAAQLEELLGCYEERFGAGRPTKKVAKKADSDDEEPEERASFGERLVDLLLSLLVRSDSTLRDLARFTFGAFTADLTGPAVDLLLDILEKKELKDGETEDTGDFEPINEEEAAASRAKAAAGGDDSDDEKDDSDDKKSSKAGSDSDSDNDDGDDSSKDIKLDMAQLSKLLGGELVEDSDSDTEKDPNAPKKDAKTLQAEFDAEDEKLATIVNLRKEQRDKVKALKRESLHFKLRICDLLETLLKRLPHLPPITDGLPMAFRLYLPLLDALSASSEQAVLNRRLTSIYKDQLCKAALIPKIVYPAVAAKVVKKSKKETKEAAVVDDEATGSVPIGNIRVVMSALMSRAARTKERDILSIINHALLFLTRLSTPFYGGYRKETSTAKKTKASNGAATEAAVAEVATVATANEEEQGAFVASLYREPLSLYLGTKHTMWNTKFFVDFFERCRSLAWRLAPTLIEYTTKAANSFLAGEAWTLFTSMLKHKSAIANHTSVIVPLIPAIIKAIETTPVDVAELAAKKAEVKAAVVAATPAKKLTKKQQAAAAAAVALAEAKAEILGSGAMDEEEDGVKKGKKQDNVKPLVKRWRAILKTIVGLASFLGRVSDDASRTLLLSDSLKTAIQRISLPIAIPLRADLVAVYRAASWEFKWEGLESGPAASIKGAKKAKVPRELTKKGLKKAAAKGGDAGVAAALEKAALTNPKAVEAAKAKILERKAIKVANKQQTKAKKPSDGIVAASINGASDSKEAKTPAAAAAASSVKGSGKTAKTAKAAKADGEKVEKKEKKDKAPKLNADGTPKEKKKKPTRRGGAKTDASLKHGKKKDAAAAKEGEKAGKRKEPAAATAAAASATKASSTSVKKSKKAKTE